MEYFPVFDELCTYKPYKEGDTLSDYNFYLVKVPQDLSDKRKIIYSKTYSMVSGLVLKYTMDMVPVEILYGKEPVRLVLNTMEAHVKNLWKNTTLNTNDKKKIMNINIGMAGKACTTFSHAEYFEDQEEAQLIADSLGPSGSYIPIRVASTFTTTESDPLDFGLEDVGSESEPRDVAIYKPYYIVVDSITKTLYNRYLPISFLKYDLQRLSLHKMYCRLEDE